MSDFFMPTKDSGYWNRKQEEQNTQQAETAGQNNGGYWDKRAENYNQSKEQHYENWNRYGVDVPDEYYNVFNQIISKAESPEQAQEEAYRIGSAVKYSQMYGISLDEAYKNVDAFNEAQFTNLTGQKARYEALCDMFTLGNNNVKLGRLGNELMTAQSNGDTELANALMAEIDTINKRNQLLQDNVPRKWFMQALEAGAQSLPFTGYVATAGIIGNFIAPAVGTGAAFLTSSYLSSGQEYIDALANGATPETARTLSLISGGIQGLIEADLGITSGIVKGTARLMGKKAAKSAAKKAVEEIGQKVFKRFHFGAGKKLVLNYLSQQGKSILGEGTEEFLQELTSIAGQEVMAALDGYDIPDDDAKHIVKQVTEAFRGGVLGAISLGFIPAGLNTRADIKQFKKVKEVAEAVESPEVFHNLVKDNPIFEGMGEENLKTTTREIWDRAQQRKDEALNEAAKEILETKDYAEGSEERRVNEQGEEEALDDVARNEEGRLDIQNDESTNDDGTVSGTFRAGDRTKEKDNRYGYINYTANEADKTVTIDAFKMAEGREGLRGELFDEFNRKYAGYKIEWNAIGKEAQAIKESLIENNPNGSKAGLSYYSDEDLSDIQTRKRVAAELKQNIYSIEQVTDANGNFSYVKKELSNKQVAAGIALLESAAKRMGMSLSNYVDKTFSSRIFATEKEFEDAVAAQGDTTTGKAGAMEWKRFGQEVKAVIYAGENADFSTWVHELAHVFQSQLTGDLKAQAEKAFNVIDGDWINSKFTFADGHTDSAAEAFAYGFQDWLKTGRAESEELKNIFQKFAEFLARAFNALKKHIEFTPEIEEVYNQLLAGDDSIMAKAEKAVEEEDRAYRAKMKADQEAKTAAAQKETEDAKKAEVAEREEKSEVTEYAEENADEVTEAEKKLDEVTNEETENESNAIDNALENLNLTDEKKTELSEVLKNPDETQQAKAAAIVDAASESAYGEDKEDYTSLGDMLFQTTDLTQDFANIKSGAVTEKISQFLSKNIKNDAEEMLFDLAELNSMAGKGYGPKSIITQRIYEIKNEYLKELAEELKGKGYKIVIGNDYLIQDNKKNNVIYFEKDGVQISFHGNFNGWDYPQAKENEWNGLYNSWKYRTKEAQKEAKEYQDFIGSKVDKIMEELNKIGKDFILKRFKKYEIEPKYDGKYIKIYLNKNTFNPLEIYKILKLPSVSYIISLGQGIDFDLGKKIKEQTTRMIEKKRAAIVNNSSSRPNIYESRNYENNSINKDFVNNNLLFQIAGEIGAQNLDDAETQKGVSRMQNLAIAKQMETEGKDAKAIRLATGWEKGSDNKWRWEIDDSKVHFDLYSAMEEWDNEHPRYKELLKKFFESELSEEEQEEFDEWVDERNYVQDKHTDLSFAEKLFGKNFRLPEVMNHPELFKAYPELKDVTVSIKKQEGTAKGDASYEDKHINLYRLKEDMRGFEEWEKEAGSVLLHEVQHIIQGIEGFAKGAAPKEFVENEEPSPLIKALSSYADFKKEELEDYIGQKEIDRLRGYGFTDEQIKQYLPDIEGLGPINEIIERYVKNNGLDAAYEEIQEARRQVKNAGKVEVGGKVYNTSYDAYASVAGEVEARNVQTRMKLSPAERVNILLKETEDVAPKDKIILFQTVYHGSGAQFDKFNTEDFGLSGEGSMSFGYGTYLTDSEEIARDYAERNRKQFDKYADNPYERGTLEREIFEDLRSFDFDKTKYKAYLEQQIKDFKTEPDNPYIDNKASEKLSKLDSINATNLYTVEIPDDGYLDYEKKLTEAEVKSFVDGYSNYYEALTEEEKQEEVEKYEGMTGQDIYLYFENLLGSDKEASAFLHSIGYAGIKYPAGTIHGNGNGAYNYVIFNDDDAKIIDHLLFQTQEELYKDANAFDSWQDFMDFYESFGKPENSLVPFDADAQWYQSTWEMARGVKTEQEQNEEKANARREKESVTADAIDALFMTALRQNPEMLDRFLTMVSHIDATDLDSEEWQNIDEEGAKARDWYERMKDFISFSLSDYNWQTAMRRVRSGNEISEGLRKRLLGEMTDPLKVRDFRAIFAEVMEDEQYAVDPQDTVAARLSEKLNKYAKKYHDIVKPSEDISRVSPERRKQIAQEMANRYIAAKIANGSLKLDDELDRYIKVLAGQTKEAQKKLDELEKETKADYQRIADAERRKLLKVHEELLLARGKMTKRNSEIERRINAGLKITEKYQRETQNMKANYDEIFRKYKDLENSIQLTAEVKEAITRQERFVELKEDLNNQKKEKSLAEEVRKMRIQLVKRTMRRVPFNRIDYENAKTVIAIQRMLEPNLMGGVNRFIGIDSPFLRGVISQILTDSDYKQKILNYLSKSQKSSKAFVNFKNKLENMKSIKEFDEWTRKEREYAIKHLPKENWVKELNLEQLAKEREESIDLDISVEERPQIVYDEKTGEPKQYKDADGQTHTVTVPVGRTVYSDEIGRRVMEAVGADMFDKIVNLSFAEWTTEDLEELAKRIDELYVEGRELLAAKNEARKREAERLRKQVEDVIKETGITINDDDTPEEKEKKLKKINKILGMSSDLKGTEAGKTKGLKARLNRLLHGYNDMNLLRFARMLDNQSEGVNTLLLYRKEDECFNAKQRSITSRADTVRKVMSDNNITEADLARVVEVKSLNTSFTVDELLYFLAADKDYEEDEKKLAKGEVGIDANDDFAATSRNAVMFGNMMSDNASQEQKEAWDKMDKDMAEALENDTLSTEQKQLLAIGQLDKTPGTTAYINSCHAKWETVLGAANSFLNENPKFKALMEAIEADYAAQYERMNEVSINEFNTPVHRVKAYVPLVRKESNGEDNVNQVKEDLLGAYGAESGKQWVNKGMTQRRVNIAPLHQKPVQTGLFNTWASSIERTEHFIAYAPYVRQLNAIYKSRDAAYTRRFIEARYGNAAIEYLDSYINEVANPKAGKIREKGAEFLHTLRGRTAPAYLGWKLSGIVKQALTSPWPYMQFVNPAEYAAACFECLNPEKKAYDAIKEKSVFMRTRSFDPIKDLIDEVSENAKSKLDRNWSKFTAMGMQGLEWIDWACVAPGWLACYKKKYNLLQKASEARYQAKVAELTEKNMTAEVATSDRLSPDQIKQKASQEVMDDIEIEAITYADDCTRQCQPSSRLTDLAPLFKNSSEAMKAFLQFQTSLNVIWQNIRYDIPYAVRQKEFARIAGTVIGYVMAGIFMNSVMDGLIGDDGEDRKELQALRNLIFYSTTQFTDAIPMIGSEITNTMDMLITGKRNFSQSGTDMTPSATKILNALTKATKGDFKKAAALTAEGIGLGLGAPVSGTKEIYKLLGKPFKEGDVNLKRGVGDVYGLAGDILGE